MPRSLANTRATLVARPAFSLHSQEAGMRSALAVLLVLLTSSAPSAEAQRTNVGVLTYTLVKGAKARPGEMTCGFKPTGVGQEEKFTGRVQGAVQEERGKLV